MAITRENGNIVLVDSAGRHVYGIFDDQYGALNAILIERSRLGVLNAMAAKNYNDIVANLQISVDNGKAETQPPKPLMQVVSDTGEASGVPFDPPLNDLRPAPKVPTVPSTGSGVTPIPVGTGGLTAAEQRAMYNMVLALYHHTFDS